MVIRKSSIAIAIALGIVTFGHAHAIAPSEDSSGGKICPKFLAMISARPTPKIENNFILNNPVERREQRTYPLGLVLTVISGKMLHQSRSMGDIGSIIGFVVGDKYDPFDIAEDGHYIYNGPPAVAFHRGGEAKALLLAQYPQLADIKYPQFKNGKDVYDFVAQQEKIFGSTLPVIHLLDSFPE
ncbi:MAG: hypothetical protein JWQ35_339 [Bacteriovoracaceae bacterium]|nr:hypothetical protein [Bacteriovoracaceae bacterium]